MRCTWVFNYYNIQPDNHPITNIVRVILYIYTETDQSWKSLITDVMLDWAYSYWNFVLLIHLNALLTFWSNTVSPLSPHINSVSASNYQHLQIKHMHNKLTLVNTVFWLLTDTEVLHLGTSSHQWDFTQKIGNIWITASDFNINAL